MDFDLTDILYDAIPQQVQNQDYLRLRQAQQQSRFGLGAENCKRGIERLHKYRTLLEIQEEQQRPCKHVDSRAVEPKVCKQIEGA